MSVRAGDQVWVVAPKVKNEKSTGKHALYVQTSSDIVAAKGTFKLT